MEVNRNWRNTRAVATHLCSVADDDVVTCGAASALAINSDVVIILEVGPGSTGHACGKVQLLGSVTGASRRLSGQCANQ
jgi:hypothetical protein